MNRKKFLHFLMLAVTLALVLTLGGLLHEKQKLTKKQHLAISANSHISMKSQTYSVYAALLRQDYETYSVMQDILARSDNPVDLVYASNNSYKSRVIESINKNKLVFKEMIGILFFSDSEEDILSYWFKEIPGKDSIKTLADLGIESSVEGGINPAFNYGSIDPNVALSTLLDLPEEPDERALHEKEAVLAPYLRLFSLGEVTWLQLVIRLDTGYVVCILSPDKELAHENLAIEVSDASGARYIHNPARLGKMEYAGTILGLNLTYSIDSHIEIFGWLILPIICLLIVLGYQELNDFIKVSQTHPLTGLPNMRVFKKSMATMMSKKGHTFLFHLDLRNLKLLNSIFLQEGADLVIKSFAKHFKSVINKKDKFHSRSGDEFFWVINLIDQCQLEKILLRIEDSFAKHKIRLKIKNNKDGDGNLVSLYGKAVEPESYIELLISFRLGGFAIDEKWQSQPLEALLDHANFQGEQAKQLEKKNEPGVAWLVEFSSDGEQKSLSHPT